MQTEFSCRCGQVQGHVQSSGPGLASRIVCYCDDCQAFAHYLGRSDLLDARGGSDVILFPPAQVTYARGQDRIEGVRLSPKGLHRFRAVCCQSPIGNAPGPSIPFVSVMASAFADADASFGKPSGAIMGRFALGAPADLPKGVPFGLLASVIAKVIGWRLRGRAQPHPFFDRQGAKPLYPVEIVAPEQRERLRALCGPHPAEPAALA